MDNKHESLEAKSIKSATKARKKNPSKPTLTTQHSKFQQSMLIPNENPPSIIEGVYNNKGQAIEPHGTAQLSHDAGISQASRPESDDGHGSLSDSCLDSSMAEEQAPVDMP